MRLESRLLRAAGSAILALALLTTVTTDAQVRRHSTAIPSIPSLSEPREGLDVKQVSPSTGYVTFASATGGGILLSLDPTTSAETRALSFVETYGADFGITPSSQMQLFRAPEQDALGIEHVRLQQFYQGVPIRGAEFWVHLDGSRVMAANGHTIDDFPESVIPGLATTEAQAAARQLIEKHRADRAAGAHYSEPALEIFNRGLLSDGPRYRSRLAWFVEATGTLLREYVWVDAQTGAILLNFSQLTDARSRKIHNGAHVFTLPGTLVRSEGGPATGDVDQDNAYTFAGITYDYYLNNHSRDSYDNAGAIIVSTAHHCPNGYPQGSTCPTYHNAFWNGTQMVYGDGFASADDVVGHELTHAVTEYSAGLFYYNQSGALNESYSDIFGETIDLLDGVGNDDASKRWVLGEDISVGAVRNMMDPTLFGHPGKMSDSAYFWCDSSAATDPQGDSGGVHTNSGIPNHAYALMVDGGNYNDTTVTGIGLTKAAKIQYRALTVYLTSGSGFGDNYTAINQSCTDLIGTAGIIASDCTQVTKALQAVEMNNTWACQDATRAPAQCATGAAINTFSDTFESVTTNWTLTNGAGSWGAHITDFAKSGSYAAYGNDPGAASDHRLTLSSAITIPAGGKLYFDHAFEFENDSFNSYDGGVLEYSTNGGSSWTDAGSLMDGGRTYNGTIPSFFGNPLGVRSGFVRSSSGYTGTRLNLASLAGQNVKFRFRVGSDSSVASLGWLIDNFTIYSCTAVATGSFRVADVASQLGTINVGSETSTVIGNTGVVLTDIAYTSSGALWGISFDDLYSVNPATGTASLIGPLGVSGMNALLGNGSTLLAASNDTTSLYFVNPSTGAATPLTGNLGYPSMGDLAFHNGMLYAAVMNGAFSDLSRIALSGNSFTATNLGHVTSDNELFALAAGADHNLYGVSGASVWRINPSDPAASTIVLSNYNANLSGLAAANGASATVIPFAHDPLIVNSSIILASDITDLRTRIAAIRLARGMTVFTWTTDPTITAGSTRVKAAHINELRTALTQVYTHVGSTAPVFTDPTVTSSTKIKALHIMELRAAVIAIE
jgi:bacillolysin